MKRYFLLLISFVAIVGLSSCEKDGEGEQLPTIDIELAQQSILVESGEDVYSVMVAAQCSWEAESENDWIVAKSGGEIEDKELQFSVISNEGDAERTGVIVVKNEELGISEKLTVVQKVATPKFDVKNGSPIAYDYKGATKSISVTANFSYDVESSADWVTWEKTTSEVKIKAAANGTYEGRSAEVRIYGSAYDLDGITITITQGACECHIGDIMTINKVEGVVYYIGNNKISLVALKEPSAPQKWSTDYTATSANDWYNGANNMAIIKKLSKWTSKYPAFKWCSDLGSGWYMPAYYELDEIYKQRELINSLLAERELAELGEWIWSSTECNHSYSYMQCFTDGAWRYYHKDDTNEVRAVYSY